MARLDIANDVHLTSAIIAGRNSAMDRAAGKLLRNIQAEASRHNLTTAFMNSWSVKTVPGESGTGRRVSDRVVYSTDRGALSINYGHFTGRGKEDRLWRGYVPGKHVVEKAIGRSGG